MSASASVSNQSTLCNTHHATKRKYKYQKKPVLSLMEQLGNRLERMESRLMVARLQVPIFATHCTNFATTHTLWLSLLATHFTKAVQTDCGLDSCFIIFSIWFQLIVFLFYFCSFMCTFRSLPQPFVKGGTDYLLPNKLQPLLDDRGDAVGPKRIRADTLSCCIFITRPLFLQVHGGFYSFVLVRECVLRLVHDNIEMVYHNIGVDVCV